MKRSFAGVCLVAAVCWFIGAQQGLALDRGYQELQGTWQVIELVDNGRVVPQQQIGSWLPSGGRMEIVDNSILFISTQDQSRHARTFEIDATSFPKSLNLVAGNAVYGQGIYDFKNGNLVVCISPPADAPRPTDFSAPPGSKRVLLVMQRENPSNPAPAATISPPTATAQSVQTVPPHVQQTVPVQTPAPGQTVTTVQQVQPNQTITTTTVASPVMPPPPDVRVTSAVDGRIRTDAEILSMIPGTWKIDDAYGAIFLELAANGTYNTFRETMTTSTFQKVFARVPVSSGTWNLNNGRIVFHCTSTSQPERLNRDHPFQVRSISSVEMAFVDYAGNSGVAVKVQ